MLCIWFVCTKNCWTNDNWSWIPRPPIWTPTNKQHTTVQQITIPIYLVLDSKAANLNIKNKCNIIQPIKIPGLRTYEAPRKNMKNVKQAVTAEDECLFCKQMHCISSKNCWKIKHIYKYIYIWTLTWTSLPQIGANDWESTSLNVCSTECQTFYRPGWLKPCSLPPMHTLFFVYFSFLLLSNERCRQLQESKRLTESKHLDKSSQKQILLQQVFFQVSFLIDGTRLQDASPPFYTWNFRGGIPWNFIYCVSFFSIDQRFQSDLAGRSKPFWIMSRPRQCCSWSLPLPCCSSTSHRHGLPEARSSPAHAQDWMPLDEVDEKMDGKMNKTPYHHLADTQNEMHQWPKGSGNKRDT